MQKQAYKTVLEDLRRARVNLYRELARSVGEPAERELARKVSDLLLAEEILSEQISGEQADDTENDEPSSPTAEPDGENIDYALWERDDRWERLGEFRRLPRGGVLVDHRTGKETFVPEGVVRNEAVEHGDVLGAFLKGANDRGGEIYYFEVLARRGRAEQSSRLSFVAPLESRSGEWGAFSDEDEIYVTVPDADIANLNLVEGDLVEIGYESGDPSSAKIAWKYDPGDTFLQLRALRKEPKKERRDKDAAEQADSQVLEGKNILVVGADAYKETFKRVFERRGAKYSWESGFMVGKFLEAKVRRADIVVIVTEAMKHKMPDVEGVCERIGKPYVYAPSRGASGALREVLKLLGLESD
ncbi:MAG: DUF2325 domain-containing protein [Eubacteriales bacterium]|nr:DUF2325 domain-containing protein [Eubacteriales bacterium]